MGTTKLSMGSKADSESSETKRDDKLANSTTQQIISFMGIIIEIHFVSLLSSSNNDVTIKTTIGFVIDYYWILIK
jgi:hypothetical protein